MQRTIDINYGRSLKFNKGSYEQDAPMWHEKVTIGFNGETPEQIAEIEKREYELLKARIDQRAEEEWTKNKANVAGLRVREKDGKKYVSVTSIINPEPYTGDPEYGTRGTEVHFIMDHWVDTGEIRKPAIELKNLKFEDLKYKEWIEKFGKQVKPIKGNFKNLEIYNDQFMYSGEIDRLLMVDDVPTLVDYKTGGWKWMQLVAYWFGLEEKIRVKIKQLAIFDLKKCELKFMAINSPEFTEAWQNFLVLRGVVKGRFGV